MSSATMSIPAGSWVLVTGGSGFLASHICLQLLYRGFRVRATVRDPAQSTWLLEGRFQSFADTGAIELVSVPDLGADGAYDEAIKGVSAILHTAYVTNVVPDPNEVITPLVNSITSVMRAATQEPLVKEVVFTGSALNSSPLKGGVDNGVVGRDSWNDGVLEAAWAPPPYDASRAMLNYPASKVAAEKEVWKFVKENEVPFNVHVISPAGLIGEPLHKKHIEGQANWVVHGYRGHRWAMDPLEASKNLRPLFHNSRELRSDICKQSFLRRRKRCRVGPCRSCARPRSKTRPNPGMGPQHSLERDTCCISQATAAEEVCG